MPSIKIDQLENESSQISAFFGNSKKLVRELDFHFEKYELRSKRQGKIRSNPRSLLSYDLPGPVFRQLRQKLIPLIQGNPKEGLVLIDALWQRKTREHRELGIILLGQLPAKNFRNVSSRVQRWSIENREESLIRDLATNSTESMRLIDPESLLRLCKKLFLKADFYVRATGLLITNSMIRELSLEYLPAILDLLIPLARNPAKRLRPYMLEVMQTFIEISPGEGLYFLQQRLAESPKAGTRWLANHSLIYFPSFETKILEESLAG